VLFDQKMSKSTEIALTMFGDYGNVMTFVSIIICCFLNKTKRNEITNNRSKLMSLKICNFVPCVFLNYYFSVFHTCNGCL